MDVLFYIILGIVILVAEIVVRYFLLKMAIKAAIIESQQGKYRSLKRRGYYSDEEIRGRDN